MGHPVAILVTIFPMDSMSDKWSIVDTPGLKSTRSFNLLSHHKESSLSLKKGSRREVEGKI